MVSTLVSIVKRLLNTRASWWSPAVKVHGGVNRISLTLVIPDLFREPVIQLPAVERLRTLATCESANFDSNFDIDHLFFRLFGATVDNSPPVAAVTHVLDSDDTAPGWWIRADPVYLHLDRNRLILFDQRILKLSQHDAVRLAAEVSAAGVPDWLSEESQDNLQENFRVDALSPSRWYLRLPGPARIHTTKLSVVHGQEIRHYLPDGERGKQWRAWLNECQILLHNSAVNAEREARGDLPVNSLWFWGGGHTPMVTSERFNRVWSNHPLVLGLARLSATPYNALPCDADHWLAQIDHPGHHLLVLEERTTTDASAMFSDINTKELDWIEKKWVIPLWKAMRSGIIANLEIYP